jgi:hypothetical protein
MDTYDIRVDHQQWIDTTARSLRGDCASLTNPLQLEMVASAALGSWGDSDELAATRDLFFHDVIAALEQAGDPHSLAFLRGLEHVAPESIAAQARQAAGRLDVKPPDFVDGIGDVTATRAWIARNPAGGEQFCVFAEYAYPAAYDHLVAVFVDDDGSIKYAGVCSTDGEPPMPEADVVAIDAFAAADTIVTAFEATDPIAARENGSIERLKLGALAHARAGRTLR